MTYIRPEEQYLKGLSDIYHKGTDITNPRTGVTCRTLINIDLTYDASTSAAPLLTTRKAPTKLPIAELLAYIRGYTSAAQFRSLGTKSWDANANENSVWLANPNRQGEDDLGLIYGAVAKNWPKHTHTAQRESLDLFRSVYDHLRAGQDNRGEIITFWNPGFFELGCLRPCLHSYQFSLVGEALYLNATQRSADWCLGVASNMVQVYVFLRLMAQITQTQPKMAYHKLVNCHIYENQIALVPEQLNRPLLSEPTLEINPDIKTLEDLETWVTVDDFIWHYADHHPAIHYPFTV